MEKLFVYGTLMESNVQKKVIGRIIEGEKDSLIGYKKSSIQIEGEIYPIIEKSKNRNDIIFGKVLLVTNEELKELDKYETDAYRRIKVVLVSGEDSWVYTK